MSEVISMSGAKGWHARRNGVREHICARVNCGRDPFACRRFLVDVFARSLAWLVANRLQIAACGAAEGLPMEGATTEAFERVLPAAACLSATSSDENLDGMRGHDGP